MLNRLKDFMLRKLKEIQIPADRKANVVPLVKYLEGNRDALMVNYTYGAGCDTVGFMSQTDISDEVKKHIKAVEGHQYVYCQNSGFRGGFFATVVFYGEA